MSNKNRLLESFGRWSDYDDGPLDRAQDCVETQPDRRLLKAVLESAIRDYYGQTTDIRQRHRATAKEMAESWFFSCAQDDGSPVSFRYVAETLDIDAEAFLNRLERRQIKLSRSPSQEVMQTSKVFQQRRRIR